MTTATLIRKTFNFDWLIVKRFNPLSSWQKLRGLMGRHGSGEKPESFPDP